MKSPRVSEADRVGVCAPSPLNAFGNGLLFPNLIFVFVGGETGTCRSRKERRGVRGYIRYTMSFLNRGLFFRVCLYRYPHD